MIVIPVPALFGDSEVIDDAFESLSAGDGAIVEAGPNGLAGAPRKALGLEVAEERVVSVVRFVDGAVLADHVGDAGVRKQASAVAVVAGDVAEVVDVAALGAADAAGRVASNSWESATSAFIKALAR